MKFSNPDQVLYDFVSNGFDFVYKSVKRPNYRKKDQLPCSGTSSKPDSVRNPPSRTSSFSNPMVDLKPLEVAIYLFAFMFNFPKVVYFLICVCGCVDIASR